ncbi:MAG: LmeA family phospholipid-binding protein [Mycobacterium sp.]
MSTPPPDEPTRRLPRVDGPTQRIPRPEPPTEQIRRQPEPATEKFARPTPPPPPAPAPAKKRNTQTIVLVAVIVVALLVGSLAGAELYARYKAAALLSNITDCLVKDGADVSFSVSPPFLWQYLSGDYTNISVATDGNQVQEAKGMTADVTLSKIALKDTGDSKGTIGSLDATLSWTSDGIKETVAQNLPVVGNLVTDVHTDTAAGTLVLEASGGTTVTAQPAVADGNLNLNVTDVTGPFAKDTVQSALNDLTTKLNDNYPLGIKADSVQVTSTGVVGKFSSQNATIPSGESNSCFADL